MPFSEEEELKMRFDVVKAFGDTAKSYIQISSAALAIPLLFTQAIFGENAVKQGLRSVGVPYTVYGSLSCFVLAILAGLIYQWASVRRVWDDLHDMQRTEQNADKPGYRKSCWWVTHFPNFNLSVPYGLMMFLFFWGVVLFAVFAINVLTKMATG
jgi:hypothetical protein